MAVYAICRIPLHQRGISQVAPGETLFGGLHNFFTRTGEIPDVLIEGFLFRWYAELLADDAAVYR